MVAYELRPMSVGEILDGAIVLLRREFGLVLSIAILCEGIPVAMDVYLDLTGGPVASPGLNLLDRLLTIVGSVYVTGAMIRVVSEAYLGRTPSFRDAMRFSSEKFGPIFGAQILSGIVTFLATLLLVVPGIIVACGYSVTAQAAALESSPSGGPLQRSWSLTKGAKWKAFALWLVSVGLFLVVDVGMGVLSGFLAEGMVVLDTVVVVFMACVSLAIYPVVSCVFTIFYYDLRVRKEAFDLEMLSQQMGVAT
jgi:uncharacterized membrane protein